MSGIRKDESGLGHSKSDVTQKAVFVDVDKMLVFLRKQERNLRLAKWFVKILPCKTYTVTYEAITRIDYDGSKKLLDFLGVKYNDFLLSSSYKKLAKGSYKDKIENYSDVKSRLKGSRFENLLYSGEDS